jgi:hypothetical protein
MMRRRFAPAQKKAPSKLRALFTVQIDALFRLLLALMFAFVFVLFGLFAVFHHLLELVVLGFVQDGFHFRLERLVGGFDLVFLYLLFQVFGVDRFYGITVLLDGLLYLRDLVFAEAELGLQLFEAVALFLNFLLFFSGVVTFSFGENGISGQEAGSEEN